MPSISLGRKEQLYVVAENDFGVAAAPAGAGAITHLDCKLQLKDERVDRADRKSTRGVSERVQGKRNVDWSIDGYLIPSGAETAAPDINDLLTCTFDKRVTPPATVSSNPTTGGATLSFVADMKVGDFVGFVLNGVLYAACLTGVNYETGAVTWTPPLPSAPLAHDTVHRSVNYRLQTSPQGSVTLHRFLDREVQTATGCIPNEWTFTFNAGDPAKWTAQGRGKDASFTGSSVLAAAMNNSQLTFDWGYALVFDVDTWVKIDNEVLKVTGVTLADHTCSVLRAQCGTSAAAHEAAAAISPYRPNPATAGSPVAGVNGRFAFGGTALPITGAKISITENVSLLDNLYGAATAMDYDYPQTRKVTWEVESLLTAITGAMMAAGKKQLSGGIFLQSGSAVGGAFACYAPKFEAEIPNIDAPADKVIPLVLSGPALEDDGDDEIFFAFL